LTDRPCYYKIQQSLKNRRAILIDLIILWDLEDDPEGNVKHIAEHGVSVDDVEAVLRDPRSRTGRSRTTRRPQSFGWTPSGKFITVIWEEVDDDPRMVYPITAYEVPPKQGRQR
jgi:hypothetical protein